MATSAISLPLLEDILAEEDQFVECDYDITIDKIIYDDDTRSRAENQFDDSEEIDEEIEELLKFEERRMIDLSRLNPKFITLDDDELAAPVFQAEQDDPVKLRHFDVHKLPKEEDVDVDTIIKILPKDSASLSKDRLEEYEKILSEKNEVGKELQKLQQRRKSKVVSSNVLSHSPLKQITDILKDGKFRRSAGFPSTFAVNNKFIALGTTHGIALVFDKEEKLPLMMLGTHEGIEYGPITGIDISYDNKYLAIGHDKGQMVIWDLNDQRPLKTFSGIHKHEIIHLRFFPEDYSIITADLSGAIQYTTLKQNLFWGFGASHTPVLKGGEHIIKDLSVLYPSSKVNYRIYEYQLVAFATQESVNVISLSVGVKLVKQIKPPEGIKSDMPLIAWRIGTDPTSVRSGLSDQDPLLAISWGNRIQVYKINVVSPKFLNPMNDLTFEEAFPISQLDFTVKAMGWLGNKVLIFITDNEDLVLYDLASSVSLETCSIESIRAVFHTKYIEGNIYGQKTAQLKKSPSISYQNALRVYEGEFYISGLSSFNVGHILSWKDRLETFRKEEKYFEAIVLALEEFEGKYHPSSVDSVEDIQMKRVFAKELETILVDYVKSNIEVTSTEMEHYQTVTTTVIDCCISIGQVDILMNKLFPIFYEKRKAHFFVEKIVTFILGDKLKAVPMDLFNLIIQYYLEKNDFQTIEQVIIHLDMSSLNFDAVVKLCRRYLSSALFYLFIHGIDDYITPLDDHMKFLMENQMIKGETDDQSKVVKMVGYKILLYLSYCFCGKSYPVPRRITQNSARKLTEKILSYLFIEAVKSHFTSYPRVSALLKFDSNEFLNILSLSFDNIATSSPERLTIYTEILSKLMIDRKVDADSIPEYDSFEWSLKQQGHLFLFLANYLSRGLIKLGDYLTRRMIAFLLCSKDKETVKIREDSLLELVRIYHKPLLKSFDDPPPITLYMNASHLLERAKDAKFLKVCEYFYSENGEYKSVIETRIKTPDYQDNVFEYIEDLYLNSDISDKQLQLVKDTTIENFRKLLEINHIKAVELLNKCFHSEHKEMFTLLKESPEIKIKKENGEFSLLHLYLLGLDDIVDAEEIIEDDGKTPREIESRDIKMPITPRFNESDTLDTPRKKENKDELSSITKKGIPAIKRKNSLLGEEEMDDFFELTCEHTPNLVLDFLEKHKGQYNKKKFKQIARDKNILDAQAFLYEQDGKYPEAVNLYLKQVEIKVTELENELLKSKTPIPPFNESTFPNAESEKNLKSIIEACISSLHRNHAPLGSESPNLWLKLLDIIVTPLNEQNKKEKEKEKDKEQPTLQRAEHSLLGPVKRAGTRSKIQQSRYIKLLRTSNAKVILTSTDRLKRAYTLFIRDIIQAMINVVEIEPVEIIKKVVETHSKEKFGDFRDIFMSLLEDSSYDRIKLTNVFTLLEIDGYHESEVLHNYRKMPVPRERIIFKSSTDDTVPSEKVGVERPTLDFKSKEDAMNERIMMIQSTEDTKVPLLEIYRKLKDSINRDVSNDERIKIGHELVQLLIPSIDIHQTGQIHKRALHDHQTSIKLSNKLKEGKIFILNQSEKLSDVDSSIFQIYKERGYF